MLYVSVQKVPLELLIASFPKLIEFDNISMDKTGVRNLKEQKSAQFKN